MYDRQMRKNERDKNRDILKDSINTRNEIIERKTEKIRRQYEEIEKEIRSLQEDKQKVFEMPITKREVLEIAKNQLSQGRELLIERMLSEHLKISQNRNTPPFTGPTMSVHLMPPEQAWKLFFFAISEKDLEKAVDLLPDIGTPKSEREAEIEKINKKIAKLQKALKEDLESEKQKR